MLGLGVLIFSRSTYGFRAKDFGSQISGFRVVSRLLWGTGSATAGPETPPETRFPEP